MKIVLRITIILLLTLDLYLKKETKMKRNIIYDLIFVHHI
jgi:hypothetical protein